MKIKRYCVLICVLFLSCNGGGSSVIDRKNSTVTETKNVSKGNEKVLLTNIQTHFFSDISKQDTFKLILTGDSLKTAAAHFAIVSYNGKMIYYDEFEGEDLMGIENTDNAIKAKAASFFNDSNFVVATKTPAVSTCGDNGIPDSVNWFDIHRDKNVIGFHYFFEGEVDDNYIAWSKKQGRVVVYWHNND